MTAPGQAHLTKVSGCTAAPLCCLALLSTRAQRSAQWLWGKGTLVKDRAGSDQAQHLLWARVAITGIHRGNRSETVWNSGVPRTQQYAPSLDACYGPLCSEPLLSLQWRCQCWGAESKHWRTTNQTWTWGFCSNNENHPPDRLRKYWPLKETKLKLTLDSSSSRLHLSSCSNYWQHTLGKMKLLFPFNSHLSQWHQSTYRTYRGYSHTKHTTLRYGISNNFT